MAAVTGMVRTLSLVVGSAYGGVYVYNNVNSDSLRGAAAEILVRERARLRNSDGGGHDSGAASSGLDRLSAQVERLSGEVSRSAGRPVVVYGGDSASGPDASALVGWSAVAFTVGTAVYYVCVWKGISFTDFLWVSRSAFNSTVTSLDAGMKSVSATVSTIRQDFTEKLRGLEFRVEGVRVGLSKKIETEVHDVKAKVGDVGRDVEGVQDMLHGVNERMMMLDGKIDTATSGIFALVRVVSSMAPEQLRPDSPFAELRRFAEISSDNSNVKAIDGSGAFKQLPSTSTFAAAALEAPSDGTNGTMAASRRTSMRQITSPRTKAST